jgi:hypothetical protein
MSTFEKNIRAIAKVKMIIDSSIRTEYGNKIYVKSEKDFIDFILKLSGDIIVFSEQHDTYFNYAVVFHGLVVYHLVDKYGKRT